jgi:hypothetical protein
MKCETIFMQGMQEDLVASKLRGQPSSTPGRPTQPIFLISLLQCRGSALVSMRIRIQGFNAKIKKLYS